VDPEYGARYRDLYEHHWWWRARERAILDTLHDHQPAGGLRTVLDVGCGDGLFFDALQAIPTVKLVEGVEPAAALVSPNGRHRAQIHIAPFDEHLDDPLAALRHALALLEPNGVFVATVPAFLSLWTRHDDLNEHRTRYTKRTFETLADRAGLRIDEIRYLFGWTAAAKVATRVVESIIPGAPKSPSVPPASINGALYMLSRLEERMLGGLLPVGSSLLVAGGKGS
jgi:SAM-dependent methyltransferase